MSTQAETRAERAGRMLAEAAEIMLGAMRGLGERLNEAETPEAAQGLAMALSRVNRGLRQTILLDARLEKDAQAQAVAAEAQAAKAAEAALQSKKFKLRFAVSREVMEACESAEAAEPYLDELEEALDTYARAHDPEKQSFEDLVEMFLSDLGFGPKGSADEAADEPADPAAAPEAPAPEEPSGPRLVQQPDFGWAPAADSS